MKITIAKEFKNDFTTRAAGERLRKLILNATSLVTINFIDVKIASSSFFDEAIAKLSCEGWTVEKIKENITFLNLFKRDKELLKSTCKIHGLIF